MLNEIKDQTKLNIISKLDSLPLEKQREIEAEIRGYIRGREDQTNQ